MRVRFLRCLNGVGFHDLAYAEWLPRGASGHPDVVCVHGLTRTGRDFDALARLLSRDRRVVCPDIAGRGRSDRLADGDAYDYPQYCADMAALLARLDSETVDWVGTSMGGLIGLMLAARPKSPIRRLVLNDIGPFLPKAALERIVSNAADNPHRFAGRAMAEAHLRRVYAPFGPISDEEWALWTKTLLVADEAGGVALHYDPAIAVKLARTEPRDVDLWPLWEAVRCPVLVIRGAESDLLGRETVARMRETGPGCTVIEVPGVGHAPPLWRDDQTEAVRAWLDGGGEEAS